MLYLTCTTITSIDLAHYGVSRAKDWVSVKCGTMFIKGNKFRDFLFALLNIAAVSKYGLLLKNKFAPIGANSFL